MSPAINLTTSLSLSGATTYGSPEWSIISRKVNAVIKSPVAKVAAELVTLLSIFLAVGLWIFILPTV